MRDTIEMTHEAGMLAITSRYSMEQLKRFEDLVRADEREACAKVCDELHYGLATQRAAEIIRARGETK